MSTHNTAEPIADDDGFYFELAEVIELPASDAPSFYQRNSGSLPKSDQGMSDAHRRTQLPKPENSDTTSIADRVRSLLKR